MSRSVRITFADCCSAFGPTCPPARPATRPWHHRADQLLAATRPQIVPLLIGLGVLASLASDALSTGLGMLPLAVFFLVAGGWCTLNLVRCREAHCLVNGAGWLILAGLALAATFANLDWRSPLWVAFFVVLGVGVCFELIWSLRQGTTALDRHR